MAYNSETDKIDKKATNGLTGTLNSAAYRINEIERHFHNTEKWFGSAAIPAGETHVADRMDGVILPFVITSGNSDFGAWTQVIGSDDTPITAGAQMFDSKRLVVTATSSTNAYIAQIISGESADLATKLANEEFSEAPYISSSNLNDSGIEEIMVRRVLSGEKVWIRIACVGANAATVSLYFGIHEYEG